LKVSGFTSGYLSIYRWAQQAMDTPIDHPLLPLLWQKFFVLYLARLPLINTYEKGCVGDKFFDGLVNFSFLKRIKRKLQETLDDYEIRTKNEEESCRKHFLETCLKWVVYNIQFTIRIFFVACLRLSTRGWKSRDYRRAICIYHRFPPYTNPISWRS
jgi:hypothetical protein